MARSKVLGIDLGTSNSAVAITEAGEAEILKNQVGEPVTPSAVRFPPPDDDKETPYVGKPALDGKHQDPERTVTSIKRKMGDSEYSITIDGESYSPPEISAYILRSLRENASDSLGVSFDVLNEAVITVPAYFSEDQRQATRTAAEMAEFDSVRIINEPTAAAMSYGYRETSEPETILVYDLGGGTFDVSVLDVGRGTFQVRSAGGDRELGGDDWDAEVADWIAEKFRDQYGTNPLEPQPTDGPGELLARESRIYEAAKDAKEEVCASEGTTTILLPYLMEVDGEVVTDFSLDFDVATLERLTGHLIDRTIEPMMDAIDEAGYNVPDLDEVILVGGATRMPQVHKQLNEIFPFEPEKCVDPDEAVAKGAAIHGDDNDILVQEVTPLTLGIGIEGGKFKPLIDRNSTLPAEGSEIFTTSENNATQVRIDVFQGEHEIVERNRKLRQFYLGDIPPQPRGVPQIEVTFRVNREGIVTARAELLNGLSDEATSEVSIDGVTDISQEEIQEHISEVREHKDDSERRVKLIETRNEVRELVSRGERYLREYENIMTEELEQTLSDTVDKANELLQEDTTTHSELEEISDSLQEHLSAVGDAIIEHSQALSRTATPQELAEDDSTSSGDVATEILSSESADATMTTKPLSDEGNEADTDASQAGSLDEQETGQSGGSDTSDTGIVSPAIGGDATSESRESDGDNETETHSQTTDQDAETENPGLPDEPAGESLDDGGNADSDNSSQSKDGSDSEQTDDSDSLAEARQAEIEQLSNQTGQDNTDSSSVPDSSEIANAEGPDLVDMDADALNEAEETTQSKFGDGIQEQQSDGSDSSDDSESDDETVTDGGNLDRPEDGTSIESLAEQLASETNREIT